MKTHDRHEPRERTTRARRATRAYPFAASLADALESILRDERREARASHHDERP